MVLTTTLPPTLIAADKSTAQIKSLVIAESLLKVQNMSLASRDHPA
jgi:hypothetical protein